MTLDQLNQQLDAALQERVELHQARERGEIDAPAYLAGLKRVRNVEDALEPRRRQLGCQHSRAFELCVIAGEIPAEPCPTCSSPACLGICPRSIPCPLSTCGARAGQRCKRPSEHVAPELHAERVRLAEAGGPLVLAPEKRDACGQLAPPLPAQLDLAGTAHEIRPDWQQARLFTPAPAPIAGQLDLGELA